VRHLGGQSLLALQERTLQLLGLRDVACDLGGSDNPAVGISQGRDRQRDVDVRACLGDPDCFVMFNPLTGSNTRQDDVLLLVPVGRNDDRDRASDRLLRRIPEHSLGRRVPRRDHPVEILGDDRVV
jgi:hypothetical protein